MPHDVHTVQVLCTWEPFHRDLEGLPTQEGDRAVLSLAEAQDLCKRYLAEQLSINATHDLTRHGNDIFQKILTALKQYNQDPKKKVEALKNVLEHCEHTKATLKAVRKRGLRFVQVVRASCRIFRMSLTQVPIQSANHGGQY
jgi:hypothetical protein